MKSLLNLSQVSWGLPAPCCCLQRTSHALSHLVTHAHTHAHTFLASDPPVIPLPPWVCMRMHTCVRVCCLAPASELQVHCVLCHLPKEWCGHGGVNVRALASPCRALPLPRSAGLAMPYLCARPSCLFCCWSLLQSSSLSPLLVPVACSCRCRVGR